MPETVNSESGIKYLFRDENGFQAKVNGKWYRNLDRDEMWYELVLREGIDPREVEKALYAAPRVPRHRDVDFIGGRRGAGYLRWVVDGVKVPKECAYHALRECGLSPSDAKTIMRIMQRHPNEELRRELQIA